MTTLKAIIAISTFIVPKSVIPGARDDLTLVAGESADVLADYAAHVVHLGIATVGESVKPDKAERAPKAPKAAGKTPEPGPDGNGTQIIDPAAAPGDAPAA